MMFKRHCGKRLMMIAYRDLVHNLRIVLKSGRVLHGRAYSHGEREYKVCDIMGYEKEIIAADDIESYTAYSYTELKELVDWAERKRNMRIDKDRFLHKNVRVVFKDDEAFYGKLEYSIPRKKYVILTWDEKERYFSESEIADISLFGTKEADALVHLVGSKWFKKVVS